MTGEKVIFEIRAPRGGEQTPEAAAAIFLALSSQRPSLLVRLLRRAEPLVFEIAVHNQNIHFYAAVPQSIASYFESQISAQYPNVSITQVKDYLGEFAGKVAFGSLNLSSPSYFPLKTWRDFAETDPLSSVLGTMAKIEPGEALLLQIVAIPADASWQRGGARVITQGITTPEGTQKAHPKANLIEKKISQTGFYAGLRLLAVAQTEARARSLIGNLAGSFGSLSLGESNSLVFSSPGRFARAGFLKSIFARNSSFMPRGQVLSVDELATIWHLPTEKVAGIRHIAWGGRLGGEPPDNLPVAIDKTDTEKQEINFIARTEFKNRPTVFGIKKEDRRRHVYIIGKTGTGKTTLIANMAINDMRNREGVAIVDPHGDLSEILLDYIPSYRINDVAYLDAADIQHPFRINLFEVKNPQQGELVASGIVSIFQKLYGFSWGPRLEYILRNSILTLIPRSGSTLTDVPRILTDREFRLKVVAELSDPVLRNFWKNEFERMSEKLQAEAISPILNKVGQFVSSPTIRNIIGFPHSTVDLEQLMNNGKIVILNLSQGRLGEDNAALLGAMVITKIQLAAMGRSAVPETARRDFYLYVDEFQNFATSSFIKILSEARKYRLNLALANQYIAQVPEDVQKAIFGNVGTLISFLVGAQDSQILAREFAGVYKEEDLVGLDNYQIIVKLAIEDKTSRPFSAHTLPLPRSKNQNRGKVIKVSQERYTKLAQKAQKSAPHKEQESSKGGTIYEG